MWWWLALVAAIVVGLAINLRSALAAFSDAEPPAVTRVVFTPTDLKARAWMKDRCEQAGLSVRQDPAGNMFARWVGSGRGPADAHDARTDRGDE